MAGTGLQPANIVLVILPFVISFSIVSTRVWRKIKEHKLAIEDWLLVVAETILLVLTSTMFVMVSYAGYHEEDIQNGAINQVDVLFWRYVNNTLYNPILGFVKISFLITLLKLRSCNRLIVASLWTLIVVNGIFILLASLGSIFKCWPIEKSWHTDVPGYCPPRPPYIFGTIGTTIATDVLVAAIPAWILYDLQMPLKNKIGVITFLSLPLAVTAIGCYRLQMFVSVFSLTKVSAEDPHNVRNALSDIEANLGVIAACGPTVKWILGRFIPYFDITRKPSGYTADPSSIRRQRTRGYHKSNSDIELQPDPLKTSYPRNTRNSCWIVDDEDAVSEKQCITVEEGKDIEKTTVVEWKSAEASESSSVLEPNQGVSQAF